MITISFPGVEAAERDKANVTISETYRAEIVEDELSIEFE